MGKIDYHIISTGSQGNAVLIQKQILIDCGVSYKSIEPYLKDIKLVLLTHVHLDHFRASTVRRIAMEKPLIRFGCGAWMVKPLVNAGVSKSQIDVLQMNFLYGYGICNVIPVELYHDVPNCGYKLHFTDGKVFYATDTGSLACVSAKAYSLYLVEANYVDEEIKVRMDEKRAR